MRAIVFDLDGTLIDSLPDIHAAAVATLAGAGAAPPALSATRAAIGDGIGPLVARLARAAGIAGGHAALAQEFLRHYSAAPAARTRPFPGVRHALARLDADGFVLGLCTNKLEALSRRILADLGLAELFPVVVGGDTFASRKPDPAGLDACFDRLGATGRLYVGDSEVDAETANRAGVPFALYAGGYRHGPVAALAHDWCFADYAALSGIAAEAFAPRPRPTHLCAENTPG